MYELVEEEEEPSLSSFFEQEILVRLKRTINIMYNIFLICYLDKKVKIPLLMRTHSLMSIGLFYKNVGNLLGGCLTVKN